MKRARRRGEPVLALINVVFLLLVFFLIAGTLARPRPADLSLAVIDAELAAAAPGVLAVARDGRLFWAGVEITAEDLPALMAEQTEGPLRLMPDRDLPARDLMALAREIEAAGQGIAGEPRELRILGARP